MGAEEDRVAAREAAALEALEWAHSHMAALSSSAKVAGLQDVTLKDLFLDFRQEVRERFDKLDSSMVHREVYDANRRSDLDRLTSLEDSRKWLVRTIAAQIIGMVVSAVLVARVVVG